MGKMGPRPMMSDPSGRSGFIEFGPGEVLHSILTDMPWFMAPTSHPWIREGLKYSESIIEDDGQFRWEYDKKVMKMIEIVGGKGTWKYPDHPYPAIYETNRGIFLAAPFITKN